MATLTENITALRTKLDQIITFMQERGVEIETGANLETILQRMANNDPLLRAVTAVSILSGTEITDRSLSDLTTLRAYGFYQHLGIKDIEIGACESIGTCAFAKCTALTTIQCSSLKTIYNAAFDGCTSLVGVNGTRDASLDLVTYIGANAFRGCTSLTGTLGLKQLSNIGENAFSGTTFTKVRVQVSVEGKEPSDFDNYPWGLPSGCVIYYGASGKTYTIE